MRLATAITWYEQGKASQEVAARIAGMNRTDFLLALARAGKDPFQVDSLILSIISRDSSRKVSFSIFASISTTGSTGHFAMSSGYLSTSTSAAANQYRSKPGSFSFFAGE